MHHVSTRDHGPAGTMHAHCRYAPCTMRAFPPILQGVQVQVGHCLFNTTACGSNSGLCLYISTAPSRNTRIHRMLRVVFRDVVASARLPSPLPWAPPPPCHAVCSRSLLAAPAPSPPALRRSCWPVRCTRAWRPRPHPTPPARCGAAARERASPSSAVGVEGGVLVEGEAWGARMLSVQQPHT